MKNELNQILKNSGYFHAEQEYTAVVQNVKKSNSVFIFTRSIEYHQSSFITAPWSETALDMEESLLMLTFLDSVPTSNSDSTYSHFASWTSTFFQVLLISWSPP